MTETILYVVHVKEPKTDEVWHYIGVTRRDPQLRLKEHIKPSGTPELHKAKERGATVEIVALQRHSSKDVEALLEPYKATRLVSGLCPLCNPPGNTKRTETV